MTPVLEHCLPCFFSICFYKRHVQREITRKEKHFLFSVCVFFTVPVQKGSIREGYKLYSTFLFPPPISFSFSIFSFSISILLFAIFPFSPFSPFYSLGCPHIACQEVISRRRQAPTKTGRFLSSSSFPFYLAVCRSDNATGSLFPRMFTLGEISHTRIHICASTK